MEELYPNLVPPQNLEAEEGRLGSILLEQDSSISGHGVSCTPMILSRCSSIDFAAMIKLNQNSEAIGQSPFLRN